MLRSRSAPAAQGTDSGCDDQSCLESMVAYCVATRSTPYRALFVVRFALRAHLSRTQKVPRTF
jgi:hypothetical protein